MKSKIKPAAIATALGKLLLCCMTQEASDCIKNHIQTSRIGFWEKTQEGRHQQLVNLLVLSTGKQPRPNKGRVFTFPFGLDTTLCAGCLAAALGCSQSLVYKVLNEVKSGLRNYQNKNRKEFQDSSKTTEAQADCRAWFKKYFSAIGDFMPHSKKVHLPPTLKKSLQRIYLADIARMGVSYKPLEIKQWRAVWKEHFPQVVVGEYSPFASCEVCAKFLRELQQNTTIAERAALRANQEKHINFVKAERHCYHEVRFDARLCAGVILSMIIDGMDQEKTYLPYRWPLDKAIAGLMRLKTHLTGVFMHGQSPSCLLFVDFSDIPHDPNLICHVINQSLLSLPQIPRHFHLQLDNTTRENKNWVVLTFLAVLILQGTFETVQVSFLPVGHTHEDIDAVFSVIARLLKRSIVTTISKLWSLLSTALKKDNQNPQVKLIQNVPNISHFLLPHKPTMKDITTARCFKMWLEDGGVRIQSKEAMSEGTFAPEGGMLLLDKLPEGTPCKVPLKPSQLDLFAKSISKFRQTSVLDEEDASEWNDWLSQQKDLLSRECQTCFSLTSALRANGAKVRDSAEQKTEKGRAFRQAQKQLSDHLKEAVLDAEHKCTGWKLPPPQPSFGEPPVSPQAPAASVAVERKLSSFTVVAAGHGRSKGRQPVRGRGRPGLEVFESSEEELKAQVDLGRRRRGRGERGRGKRGRGGRGRGRESDSSSDRGSSSESCDSDLDRVLDQVLDQDAAEAAALKANKRPRLDPEQAHEEEVHVEEANQPLCPSQPQPPWRRMGIEVGQLVVLKGDHPDSWWVGEVRDLLDVVWSDNAEASQLPTHDMVVYQFEGEGATSSFRKTRVSTEVWSHSVDQAGSKDELLTKGCKLRKNVQKRLGANDPAQ